MCKNSLLKIPMKLRCSQWTVNKKCFQFKSLGKTERWKDLWQSCNGCPSNSAGKSTRLENWRYVVQIQAWAYIFLLIFIIYMLHHHHQCSALGQVFHCKLRHQGCRSSTTNSGTKVAVLLGMHRCGSFPLLSAPHSLFSI